jgi:hypothetical protein
MPPHHPPYFISALVVLGVKFAGYSLAANLISQAYERSDLSARLVGGVRTLVGVAGAALYVGLLLSLFHRGLPGGFGTFLPGLVLIRFAEWWLLIWLFYDRGLKTTALDAKVAVLGTIWSFALDVVLLVITGLHLFITRGGFGM